VELGWETFSGRVMAAVDFEDVVSALDAGELPCASSEGQMLRLAASIAAAQRAVVCAAGGPQDSPAGYRR
jgi:hypothetical protein